MLGGFAPKVAHHLTRDSVAGRQPPTITTRSQQSRLNSTWTSIGSSRGLVEFLLALVREVGPNQPVVDPEQTESLLSICLKQRQERINSMKAS
jgi:hypothetical protein